MSVLFLKGVKSQRVVNLGMIFVIYGEKGTSQEASCLPLNQEPFFSPPLTSVQTSGMMPFFLCW